MNDKILKSLESAINDNQEATRRRFPRRVSEICVAAIDGTNHPVIDWSQCGVLFDGDGRDFEDGSEHDVVMKFKLADVVTEIPVKARVARASKTKVAMEFFSVPKKIQEAFSKVIEDTNNHSTEADTQQG